MAQAMLPTYRNELVITGEMALLLVGLPLILLLVILSRPLFIIAAVSSLTYGALRNGVRRA